MNKERFPDTLYLQGLCILASDYELFIEGVWKASSFMGKICISKEVLALWPGSSSFSLSQYTVSEVPGIETRKSHCRSFIYPFLFLPLQIQCNHLGCLSCRQLPAHLVNTSWHRSAAAHQQPQPDTWHPNPPLFIISPLMPGSYHGELHGYEPAGFSAGAQPRLQVTTLESCLPWDQWMQMCTLIAGPFSRLHSSAEFRIRTITDWFGLKRTF